MKTPGDGDHFNLLVVGESWAVGGRFFPELPAGVSERVGKPVLGCAIGFSGRNTGLLNDEIRKAFPPQHIAALFDNNTPDAVVIMNGVNDIIQHAGSAFYSDETASLANYFQGSIVQVIAIPRVNESPPSRGFLSDVKRYAQALWYDAGEMAVNDTYRAKLRNDHPEIRTIDYDGFIPTFTGHEAEYTPDGIHLTLPAFKQYGRFLAPYVAAPFQNRNAGERSTIGPLN